MGNKVDMRVAKFLVPIGAIINIEGAGVYELIVPVFIGQINGWSMDVGQLITVRYISYKHSIFCRAPAPKKHVH